MSRKNLLLAGLIGFAGGWVAKCFQVRKMGVQVPPVKSYEAVNDEKGSRLEIKFSNGDEMTVSTEEEAEPDDADLDIQEYDAMASTYTAEAPESTVKPKKNRFPCIITEEEFEEEDGLKKRHLTFYLGDGVLTDEEDKEIDNWREMVGVEPLSKMETFGERIQLVRNEAFNEKYEILLNEGFYDKDDGR